MFTRRRKKVLHRAKLKAALILCVTILLVGGDGRLSPGLQFTVKSCEAMQRAADSQPHKMEAEPVLVKAEDERLENASNRWTPYQFAIWDPVQLFDEKTDVRGLRTSIFYGKNRDVYGLDISLFANNARNVYGISILGFGNEFYHGIFPFAFWHYAPVDTGNVTGIQIGGGLGGAIGILLPCPMGYYALVTTRARDMTGLQISLLGSRARRLSGIQIAGLFTVVNGSASGVQIAGLFTVINGSAKGLQLSGLSNIARGNDGTSFQIGLIYNKMGRDYGGLQLGTKNIALGKLRGMQFGIFGNEAGGFQGVQLAGVLNYSSDDSRGFQLGLFNVAREGMKGVQIGAVNYCRRMTGLQIGGLNIIREGTLPFFFGINASISF